VVGLDFEDTPGAARIFSFFGNILVEGFTSRVSVQRSTLISTCVSEIEPPIGDDFLDIDVTEDVVADLDDDVELEAYEQQ